MAQTSSDYFASTAPSSRPSIRTRAATSAPNASATSPGSPRTPLLGRSISSQFGSPGAFRSEQEDFIVLELGPRHLSAGFAGESRPRCVLGFSPDDGRRAGDFRQYDPSYVRKQRVTEKEEDWAAEHELYRTDVRGLDLGLVEDRLERVVRKAHVDFLQLDNKPRKVILTVPSLLPLPILEIILKVLFNHYAQPPSVTLLTTPIMACVGAGLRTGLVVDVGWEETTVTAIGEYREVFQRRTVRAGSMVAMAMRRVLNEEVEKQCEYADGSNEASETPKVNFEYTEDVKQRLAWCPNRERQSGGTGTMKIPSPDSDGTETLSVGFARFSEPVEETFFPTVFPTAENATGLDDHDLAVTTVVYNVLLALPPDLRALCLSRIVLTGTHSKIPGLRFRLLQDLQHLINMRGWDPVASYGSATEHHDKVLVERSRKVAVFRYQRSTEVTASKEGLPQTAGKRAEQDALPAHKRIHDDKHDHISLKAEREAGKGKVDPVSGFVRGVETLGAWSGASLVASLRVKGVCEVERDEFLKHGLRDVNF